MAAPWEKYAAPNPAAPAPAGVLGTIPGRVDPYKAQDRAFKVEDQALQRESNARAAEAAARAAQAAERSATADERTARTSDLSNLTKLRNDFQALPQVKTYAEFLPALFKAVQAPDNAAGDLAILYAFSKSMDPTTGVREGEQAMARNTASMAGQAETWLKRVNEGERLPAEVRRNLVEVMRETGKQYARPYDQQRQYFEQVAQRAGYDPFEIVGPHAYTPFAEAEKAYIEARGGTPKVAGVPVDGQAPDEVKAEMDRRLASGDNPADIIQWLISIDRPPNKEEIEKIVANQGNPDVNSRYATRQPDPVDPGAGNAGDLVMHGAMLGLSDEASGVGRAAANIIMSPLTGNFDPAGAYQAGNQAQDQLLEQARQRSGWMGTAAEIGGGFASGGVSNALAAAPSLLGRMGQGARAGAAAGGIGGFGYGEGPSSLLSAGAGALGGAAVGAALPVAGQVIGNQVQGVRRMVGRDPALPRNMVSRAIEADGNTPAVVGQVMDEAHARGSPMMLADTGDNTRALLASVGRQPGPSRTLTRQAVIDRQQGQTDRIGEAVVRDLGPTANIQELGDELITRARTEARPLYERFEAASGASVVKVDDLATRPSFRKALANAVRTAEEEGVDPTALGFRFNEAGEMTLDREAISWRTMDAVKKGLDDVVESYRDPTSGKLNLNTNEARATNATLRTLIARMDRVNPVYAEARAAYAGPAAMRSALEKGAKALNQQPDDILAAMRNMGDSEQEAYRTGVRKAIVDKLATVRDGGDKVGRLIGTPKARAVLTRVFGGRGNFERFVQTLRDEEAMGMTYRSVTGNSATAERLAEDATTNDGGLVEAATNSAIRGARNGSGVMNAWVADIFEGLQNASRFGTGEAGQRARESVAALLTETDPTVLRELIQAARQAARDQGRVNSRRGRRAISQGRNIGSLSGMATGQATREPR